MERSSKRGKIPPQDWPSIITRYEAGETLASIARTYDCSPPAISYIVSRSRARNAAAEAHDAAPPQEPQLIKSHSAATPSASIPPTEATLAVPPPAELLHLDSPAVASISAGAPSAVAETSGERPDPSREPAELQLFAEDTAAVPQLRREQPTQHAENPSARQQGTGQRLGDPHLGGNGNAARPPAPTGMPSPNGEPRRTLHLSLPAGDGGQRHELQPHVSQSFAAPGVGERAASHPAGAPGQPARPGTSQSGPAGNGALPRSAPEPSAAKEGRNFIDHALRERVDGDIAAFLAAFDAALDHDTVESRAGLREATDRLLRAGARTRIELERLEARVPLVPREKGREEARAFRPR
jgi:hypothetical protein